MLLDLVYTSQSNQDYGTTQTDLDNVGTCLMRRLLLLVMYTSILDNYFGFLK